jgi:hypothetical protein
VKACERNKRVIKREKKEKKKTERDCCEKQKQRRGEK